MMSFALHKITLLSWKERFDSTICVYEAVTVMEESNS